LEIVILDESKDTVWFANEGEDGKGLLCAVENYSDKVIDVIVPDVCVTNGFFHKIFGHEIAEGLVRYEPPAVNIFAPFVCDQILQLFHHAHVRGEILGENG